MVKESLKNIAYDYLFDSIVSHELLPGEAIIEQEVSNRLGISRTPVREALNQLTAEGLVRSVQGRGTFVEELSEHDIEEIFELRIIFEEIALKSSINEFSDREVNDLQQMFESLKPNDPPEEYYKCDRKLHETIRRHGHNRRSSLFLNTINAQLEILRRISAMEPNRLERSRREHLELIYAIKERDVEEAVEKLRMHLTNVKKSTLSICKQMRLKYEYAQNR